MGLEGKAPVQKKSKAEQCQKKGGNSIFKVCWANGKKAKEWEYRFVALADILRFSFKGY